MEALDALVARVVAQARAFERAVHDVGPWGISLDGASWVPAERRLGTADVLFRAEFPALCRVEPRPAFAELLCNGEFVSGRALVVPDEVPFAVEWEIEVPAAVGA